MQSVTVGHSLRSWRPARDRRGRVDVWQVSLDVDEATLLRALTHLSAEERQRAERGTADVRRRRIALRAALRCVLARELGCRPQDVPLDRTAAGRPQLPSPARRTGRRRVALDISCTASGDLGLVAVGRGTRVGVDLEQVAHEAHPPSDEDWLTPREIAALRAAAPDERPVLAARAWTAKEAVLKAVGCGLSTPPICVESHLDGPPAPRAPGWTLRSVAVPPGLVATLATARPLPDGGGALVPRVLSDLDRPDEGQPS
jgi:4'-phosphopantetheinyl transferase